MTRKMQALDQAIIRHVGIEPATCPIIVLKSSVHFRADFGPIAGRVIVAVAPGPVVADPATLNFRQVRGRPAPTDGHTGGLTRNSPFSLGIEPVVLISVECRWPAERYRSVHFSSLLLGDMSKLFAFSCHGPGGHAFAFAGIDAAPR